jgi:aminocarboxymuconate-semialdehyde decarboxylase
VALAPSSVDCKKSPRDTLGSFWVDSLVHDKVVPSCLFEQLECNAVSSIAFFWLLIASLCAQVALRQVLDLVGKDKMTLGSDYPFPLGEDHPGLL